MTEALPAFPTRFRRRLALAFVGVAAVAAGGLALGSYWSVKSYRVDSFHNRAERVADLNLALAAGNVEDGGLDSLFDLYERRGEFETLVVRNDGRVAESAPGLAAVAGDLPAPAEPMSLTSAVHVSVGGVPHLVVGGTSRDSDDAFYYFFSEASVHAGLDEMRGSLAAGWAIVVLLAALVGTVVARRTLAPVASASAAARSLTLGLLEGDEPQLDARLHHHGADEFSEWARSFNEMAAALQAKITALREAHAREQRFTENVAHELRTPLGALVANSSLLEYRLDELPDRLRRPAELLLQDVKRLQTLVVDLLELARLDAGHQDVHPEPLSLRHTVEAVVSARPPSRRPATELDDAVVMADRRRIERVVANLVENAYAHGGGDVRVTTGAVAGFGFVAVADRGPGVDKDDVPRLFERFYKADASHSTSGSGLGLAIARDNARVMGGDIDVESERDRGSVFTVRLPLARNGDVDGADEV